MYKLLFILLFSLPINIWANAAQPGFWGAGGTGTFSLLFPEDSLQFKKIQMVKEIVSVQLYRGYAVVKGEYCMYNATSDPITIKVGYPINSGFSSKNSYNHLTEIRFDSLYGLNAYKNGEQVTILTEKMKNPDAEWGNENWFVWENTFTALDTTVISVYFIVNTNNTIIRRGYNNDYNNGFIYLLETGSTWKQPIVEGEIKIKLMDDLSIEDIKGLSPDSLFMVDLKQRVLITRFQNLSPSAKNNITISYSEKVDDFHFQHVLNNKELLYDRIDFFSSSIFTESNLVMERFENPIDFNSSNWFTSMLLFLLFAGLPIFIIAGVLAGLLILVIIIVKKS